MESPEGASPKDASSPVCPNCGEPAPGRFCASCGQRQGELVPKLRSLLNETLGEILFVEARLPKTLRALFWPPGFLTQEWWQGRRVPFVSPVRLYLLAAIPFFFVFSLPKDETIQRQGFLEFLVWASYMEAEAPAFSPHEAPPAGVATDSVARAEWLERRREEGAVDDALQEVADRKVGTGVRRILDILPIVVGIIMVPLLALFLAFGARPAERFVARMVLSLHLHTVGYVLAVFGWIMGLGLGLGFFGAALYFGAARHRLKPDSILVIVVLTVVIPSLYALGFMLVYVGLLRGLSAFAPGWIFAG